MTYRIFIGGWDDPDGEEHDYVKLDKRGLDWNMAVMELAVRLDEFSDFECDQCRQDAIDGVFTLTTMLPGRFHTMVDGDDYLIIPE